MEKEENITIDINPEDLEFNFNDKDFELEDITKIKEENDKAIEDIIKEWKGK